MGNSSIGTKIGMIRTPQSECMLNKQPDPCLEYSLFFSEGWDEDDKKNGYVCKLLQIQDGSSGIESSLKFGTIEL